MTSEHSPSKKVLIHKEISALVADFFNNLPIEALKGVPEGIAHRIGDLMVDNGYRIVFNRWYLQAEPRATDEPGDVPKCVLCGHPMGEHDVTGIQKAPGPRGFFLLCPTETKGELCPHGMPLAENICGPCSQGRPNRPPLETSEGIDLLAALKERLVVPKGHFCRGIVDRLICHNCGRHYNAHAFTDEATRCPESEEAARE